MFAGVGNIAEPCCRKHPLAIAHRARYRNTPNNNGGAMRSCPTTTRLRVLSALLTLTTFSTPHASAQAAALPRLVPAFTTHDIDLSPINRLTALQVGPQGNVLFVNNATPSTKLLLVDSTGKQIARFGRSGAGPGEVQMPLPLAMTREGIAVWDPGNGRMTEWDVKGTFKRSVVPAQQLQLVDAAGTDLLGMHYDGKLWKPMSINRATGAVHELLLPSDTFLTAHFGGPAAKGFSPTLGTWDNGFVYSDPATYRIAFYRWNGSLVRVLSRDLPAFRASGARMDEFIGQMTRGRNTDAAMLAKMRDQFSKMDLPFITPGSPARMDAKHRLWILAMEGDSASADLFTADRFVGRLHLPCRLFNGYWSVSGTWLALACLPDDPNSVLDAVIKLFRIVDTGR